MKIFISHSSQDKIFVEKLSLDLLRNGLPVWLDNWEMQVGDSLYQKIFSGLDNSSYVIVIVSKNYNKSIWTSKEFRAILAKEDRENRTVLIPILIDETEIPLEISDRIYSNFIGNYDKQLMKITRFFNQSDISIKDVQINDRLVPLVFDDYVHLDKELLISILKDRKNQTISKKQIWIKDLDSLEELILKIKNSIENNPSYEFSLKNQLKTDIARIEKLINHIYDGTELVLNAYMKSNNIHFASISLYWLHKQILGIIYKTLYRYADLKKEYGINLEPTSLLDNAFGDNHSFCKFFDIDDVRFVVIYDPNNTSDYYSFFIDRTNYASRLFDEIPLPGPVSEFFNADLFYKYLIPQNVFSHLVNNNNIKLMTEFEKYYLGLN